MENFDIVIVGASFSGLSLAHHLPKSLRILILDGKTELDQAIESTGLITQATRGLLADFVDVDSFIPNKINTIAVVSPDYDKYFFSHTDEPWIYSTDTPQLIKRMSQTLSDNIKVRLRSSFLNYDIKKDEEYSVCIEYQNNGDKKEVRAKFLVGADGANSTVAKSNLSLSQNKKFLVGYEKVFYGDIDFGDHPENTVYHFWFGEFSLGYGGWLSPTIINGKKAFRLGLAKLKKDANEIRKVDEFVEVLKNNNIIKIDPKNDVCALAFGHLIPIGGVLPKIHDKYSLLIGDAGGFCGAFAADGIKGSVLSGKVAARLIPRHLNGDNKALGEFSSRMQKHQSLMTYYKKQVSYRKLWNIMKSDRTFHAMYDLIAKQKNDFLNQFCDSKDKGKSLVRVVLQFKNIPLLIKYSCFMLLDFFKK